MGVKHDTMNQEKTKRNRSAGVLPGGKVNPDTILKNFWRDNARFADLINAVLFQGEPVIMPENLTEVDADESAVITLNGHAETVRRILDMVRKNAFGVDFVVWGLENQMKIHYAMPLRVMTGDTLGYLKECAELAKKNKEAGQLKDGAELLSGLRKDDRLHPMITICVYYGEEEWDGPLSLTEMLKIPEWLHGMVNDYRIHLVQVRDSGELHFRNEDVAAVFDLCREVRQKNYGSTRELFENRDVSPDVALTVGAVTGMKRFIQNALKSKGEKIPVWKSVMEHEEECRQKGIREGMEKGMEKGMQKGMEEGIIKTYYELGSTKQAAAAKIGTEFGLSQEEAWKKVRKFWGN